MSTISRRFSIGTCYELRLFALYFCSLAPSLTMFEILVQLSIFIIRSFVFMLRFPNPMILRFIINWKFVTLFSLYSNQFGAPFVNHLLFNHMLLHFNREKNLRWTFFAFCFKLHLLLEHSIHKTANLGNSSHLKYFPCIYDHSPSYVVY